MDKIIYIRGGHSQEAQKIELDISENPTASELKIIVMRLAAALGYSDETIKRVFGKDPEDKVSMRTLLLDVRKGKGEIEHG